MQLQQGGGAGPPPLPGLQARLQHFLVMQQLGRAEDALDTLQHDEQAELLNPHLMYSRCCSLLPALCSGLSATCYLLPAT